MMARYCWYRLRFFVHIYQQVGYKHNEYWQWLRGHWEQKVIPGDLALYNILLFILVIGLDWIELDVTLTAITIALFIWGFYWFSSVKRYKQEKVKKPLVFTSRVKRLMVPLLVMTMFLPAFFTFWSYTGMIPFLWLIPPTYDPGFLSFEVVLLVFGWVLTAILIPFYLLIAGNITKPIERNIQKGFKKQARKKLASMPHLKVIAITGSYGKTLIKFMIKDLLKERYSVCYTPGSFNTPMGICKVINNDLQSHHQILILEMGARYAGNIQELCDIAKPDVSVVSNVGFAHLESFGSQDVIAKEKGTIVDNLDTGGVAILNADDPRVSIMGEGRPEISRTMVGLESGEIRGENISYDTSGTRFEVKFGEDVHEFRTRLLGAHNVQNLLLAIGVAQHFEIRPKTMAIAAKTIEPVEHRLELKKAGELFIIDDAFNSNPVGAKNAVEILSQFEDRKRFIITPGMVELGEIEEEENFKFGEAIGRADLDYVILVGKERSMPIKSGIENIQDEMDHVFVVESLFAANEIVKEKAVAGDVILYENDLPDVYNE
jgi:UDP-N-acetylmuramoyl-tripeptide--D-alanyl-D-alanine ligase